VGIFVAGFVSDVALAHQRQTLQQIFPQESLQALERFEFERRCHTEAIRRQVAKDNAPQAGRWLSRDDGIEAEKIRETLYASGALNQFNDSHTNTDRKYNEMPSSDVLAAPEHSIESFVASQLALRDALLRPHRSLPGKAEL